MMPTSANKDQSNDIILESGRLQQLHNIYIHTYTHTYIYIYIYTYIHTQIEVADSVMMPTSAHRDQSNDIILESGPLQQQHILTYTHTHTHTYIHTYIHTHTHIYTYIHTYIHIHTHTDRGRRQRNDAYLGE